MVRGQLTQLHLTMAAARRMPVLEAEPFCPEQIWRNLHLCVRVGLGLLSLLLLLLLLGLQTSIALVLSCGAVLTITDLIPQTSHCRQHNRAQACSRSQRRFTTLGNGLHPVGF